MFNYFINRFNLFLPMKYFSQLNKHTQAHTTDLCHNFISQS